MTNKVSRREFLKLAGITGTAAAVLTGCGPASRYVEREPYTKMPEYTYNGQTTYYATTCRECPAGCGIVAATIQGRVIKIEGNKDHPVNLGKTCSRGQAALQGVYNPDRVKDPVNQYERGTGQFVDLDWEESVSLVVDALRTNKPNEIAFLFGLAPDHLFDLVTEITQALNAPPPLRYGAFEIFEARATLVEACKRIFNSPSLPFFDLGNADLVFSFGANFLETYHSPVAYGRGFAEMRRGNAAKRGYFVHFESRLSQTAAAADEWIPLSPGTEGQVALTLGRLIAEVRGEVVPNAFLAVDTTKTAKASGIGEDTLNRLAKLFAESEHPLAFPGGAVLGQTNGLEAAEAILAINVLVDNMGKGGGIYLTPSLPVHSDTPRTPNTLIEVNNLITRMREGKVKALFVHGVNPVFEFPHALGFGPSLANVPLVISFASYLDETAMQADYIFPDHTGLESWGYQKVVSGGDRQVLSGFQPVVGPVHNTRATADILLAAVSTIGGDLASQIAYQDEVDFIQQSMLELVPMDGKFNAPEIRTFMAQFQQYGGWWSAEAGLATPDATGALKRTLQPVTPEFEGDGTFHLYPFPSPLLSDGSGANKPWLQETPDPMTTVMWNSWVEVNPKTAEELGLHDDDVIKIKSASGEIDAVVYIYPAIRPDTIAIPFGQGHTAFGRYATGRGTNPAYLFGLKVTEAGDLAFGANLVKIEKTGRQHPIARLESRIGVYGDGLEH
jgi:anaerobic selenocysteine-containing dehydrogenase